MFFKLLQTFMKEKTDFKVTNNESIYVIVRHKHKHIVTHVPHVNNVISLMIEFNEYVNLFKL